MKLKWYTFVLMINNTNPVPHLTTALKTPLSPLEKNLLGSQAKIESWLQAEWQKTPPPFYSSVDLRNAGFKLAPVDTNIYPAGFNNLNPDFHPMAIQAAKAILEKLQPVDKKIILIPENHTRNTFYFENFAVLQEILTKAGFAVRLGSLRTDLIEPQVIDLPSGRKITIEKLKLEKDLLGVEDFTVSVAILNNDLSDGMPELFKNTKTTILPSPQLGWMRRLKSEHFQHYENLTKELAEAIDIDNWLINPLFTTCDNLNFVHREGETTLAEKVDELLAKIQSKYNEYSIKEQPYVVVKADSGTYGMGVLSIKSGSEILELNRKKRTSMAAAKGDRPITQVIIQEGVHTLEKWGEAMAEPVIYMIGEQVIGAFYRVHPSKTGTGILNAPGMQFKQLSFEEEKLPSRFYVYSVIARLATLAAAREERTLNDG